jgi:hypothetical protein
MKHLEKARSIIDAVYNDTDNEKAFTKYFKTISDFYVFQITYEEIVKHGYAYCFIEDVIKLYKRLDFQITKDYVNYKISLKEIIK